MRKHNSGITRLITVVAVFSLVFISGCAKTNKFDHTPVAESEFSKPIETLKSEYSDIELFESYWRGFPPQGGELAVLEEKWGKPNLVEADWSKHITYTLLGGAFWYSVGLPLGWIVAIDALLVPVPEETYVWNKADTKIDATVVTIPLKGWKKEFTVWKWQKVEPIHAAAVDK